jgi:disulfide bond formation protein DsbB
MTNTEPSHLSRDKLLLAFAFLIALTATLGALFIGEVLGQMPCTLCWYQRIAMFPLVPILGMALWRGDGMARLYALPLVLAGLALAGWHSGLYLGFIPEVVAPCTKGGPSCSGPAQIILGLPIPYLSLAAFAAILVCLILPKGTRA